MKTISCTRTYNALFDADITHSVQGQANRLSRLVVLGVVFANALVSPAVWAGDGHSHEILGTHVHGQSELEVSAFGNQLVISLLGPAANLIGFEHKAETPKQIKQVQAVKKLLANPSLISLKGAEDCTLTEVDLSGLDGMIADDADHDHGHDEKHKNHHDHGHDKEHGHSDLEVVWQHQCKGTIVPTVLDASPLFNAFPGIKQLDVALASDQLQTGGVLSVSNPTLSVSK